MSERNGPPQERSELNRIVNRHMARLLDELHEAGCPAIFRDAVKAKMQWLRSDLNELEAQNGINHSIPSS